MLWGGERLILVFRSITSLDLRGIGEQQRDVEIVIKQTSSEVTEFRQEVTAQNASVTRSLTVLERIYSTLSK